MTIDKFIVSFERLLNERLDQTIRDTLYFACKKLRPELDPHAFVKDMEKEANEYYTTRDSE